MYSAIRIVNSGKLWQNNESNWAEISVYDALNNTLITTGHDCIVWESVNGKTFMSEMKVGGEGIICYNATFTLDHAKKSNTLTIQIS